MPTRSIVALCLMAALAAPLVASSRAEAQPVAAAAAPSGHTPPSAAPPPPEGEQALSVSEVLDQFDDYIETTQEIEGRLTLLGRHDAVLKQEPFDSAGLTVDLGDLPAADQALLRAQCREACAVVLEGRIGRIMARQGILAARLRLVR